MNVDQLVQDGLVAGAEWVSETASTNTALMSNHELGGWCHGVFLYGADRQTAGRGRRGNRWEANDGALTFSLLVPRAKTRELMAMRVALAVADALGDVGLPAAAVKWPNDILVGDRKIAGILIEDALQRGFVVGIGINVLNSARHYDERLRDLVTSVIDQVDGRSAETAARVIEVERLRYDVLRAVLVALQRWMVAVVDDVVQEFRRRDAFLDRPVVLRDGPGESVQVRGIARGLATTGAYVIASPEGALTEVHSGTLRLAD